MKIKRLTRVAKRKKLMREMKQNKLVGVVLLLAVLLSVVLFMGMAIFY